MRALTVCPHARLGSTTPSMKSNCRMSKLKALGRKGRFFHLASGVRPGFSPCALIQVRILKKKIGRCLLF